ncbi:hypothetical protein JHK82_033593 [Glycine max]|nr:hypothetical protein JHK87_033527 [Glycine soja]KAG4985981.1 hypothetical protein JHK86_033672 [Glycine max]KAG5119173.1 hypothetical protein JHK82_033593 [Glycine max]KAH1221218.1 hypothetical protein GmHk_12G034691 [Glycine max]
MAEELSTVIIPQLQASSTKKRPSKNENWCLEDYLLLIHSRQTLHLTINQLNQKVLVDAVESLDLVDLPRSTVQESMSAFAAVALEDVVVDLGELNWQECCVTSVEKISFSNGQSVFPGCSNQSLHVVSHSQSQAQKENRIDETRDLIPEAFRRSLKPTKMVPKRKRSNARDSVASTVDSASLASC